MRWSREEDFLRNTNNAFSLYGHALLQDLLLRGNEIYNFDKPFLDHH